MPPTIGITDFQYKRAFIENLNKPYFRNDRMIVLENLSMMHRMKSDRTRVDPGSIPEISKRLRLLRKVVAANQTELCSLTGITRAAWSNYEKARDRIGVDAAMKLCRTYGASLDWIYFGDDEFLRAGLRDRIRQEADKEDGADSPTERRSA